MNIFKKDKNGLTFIVMRGSKRENLFSNKKIPETICCSRCQIDVNYKDIRNSMPYLWKYCPYCGRFIDGYITESLEEEIREKASEALL
jgi:hypothetical protein